MSLGSQNWLGWFSSPGHPIIMGKVENRTLCLVPEVHWCYNFPNIVDANCVQLHGFSNASEGAYTAVIYLYISMAGPNDTTRVSPTMAKTKVAPKSAWWCLCWGYAEPIWLQVFSTAHKKCLKSLPAMCLPRQSAESFLTGFLGTPTTSNVLLGTASHCWHYMLMAQTI